MSSENKIGEKIVVKPPKLAYPPLPEERAILLELKLKTRYEISDYLTESGQGYLIRDKKKDKEIIFSPNSRLTLETRYLTKNDKKEIGENILDLFSRVAVNIATADSKYDPNTDIEPVAEQFLESMLYKEFIPNTPTLCNAGRPLQQLSACFVLPVEDYIATDNLGIDPEKREDGIFDILRCAAMIHKSGGGTGFNFSHLRPRNDYISNTFGLSSGPVSFIKTFDAATEAVNQGGFRRGANMGIMEYWHPDIFEFVHEKLNGTLSNFNLSVGVNDEFMQLVSSDNEEGYFSLVNPRGRTKFPPEKRKYNAKYLFKQKIFGENEEGQRQQKEYLRKFEEANPSLLLSNDGNKVTNRYTGEEVGYINEEGEVLISAKKLFDYIVKSSWSIGCPGLVFLDIINRDNPTPHLASIEATNPCGEQPLLPFEACNLGAVNLSQCITERGEVKEIDYAKLEILVRCGVHFLDNVIDMSQFPIRQIYQMVQGNRKIGLGLMGWAEALFKLEMSYDSSVALKLAEKISKFITTIARDESIKLARERGVFPNWDGSIYDPESEFCQEGKVGLKVRNATLTTIAPNGTTAMIADTSSGIEPVFSLYYTKICMDGRRLEYKIAAFEEDLKSRSLLSEDILNKIRENGGRIQNLKAVPEEMKKIFKTAMDILPEYHIKMQAAFQKGIDNAVSKTVNLPFTATPADVAKIYINAWKWGCKGITVFRDGSRDNQVLTTEKSEKIELISAEVTPPRTLEVAVRASKYTFRRKRCGDTLHIIIRDKLYVDDKAKRAYFLPYEVFCERAPIGTSQSVDFQMDGLDRSVVFRSEDPNYAEQIVRWKSPASAEEEEGIGPAKLKSKHHAFGLAVEYHLLQAGVVAYDRVGILYNTIRKKDLREVTNLEEQKKIMALRGENKKLVVEQNVAGNVKLGKDFECEQCGSKKYYFESGCHSPKCLKCNWSDGNCG